jgi:hypothetical protein
MSGQQPPLLALPWREFDDAFSGERITIAGLPLHVDGVNNSDAGTGHTTWVSSMPKCCCTLSLVVAATDADLVLSLRCVSAPLPVGWRCCVGQVLGACTVCEQLQELHRHRARGWHWPGWTSTCSTWRKGSALITDTPNNLYKLRSSHKYDYSYKQLSACTHVLHRRWC